MTIPFEIVRALLVAEVVTFTALAAPFPLSWRRKVIDWMSTSSLYKQIRFVLIIVFSLVCLLFLESLRSINSAAEDRGSYSKDSHGDTQLKAKMFYAQRNLYLTAFTLFMAFVLNAFSKVLIELQKRGDRLENIRSQAVNQSSEYLRIVDELEKKEDVLKSLSSKEKELDKKAKNIEAYEKQIAGLQAEYMRLSDAHSALEAKFESRTESKKDQ